MGDKVILQIVPSIVGNVLDNFEGETIMNWKNLSLRRLEGQDISIWQMIDDIVPVKKKEGMKGSKSTSGDSGDREGLTEESEKDNEEKANTMANIGAHNPRRHREIDSSLFLPQVDAIIIFYEIKDQSILREWIHVIVDDVRVKKITPMVVGCHQKGENTKEFRLLMDKHPETFFLWRIDDQDQITEIYENILNRVVSK